MTRPHWVWASPPDPALRSLALDLFDGRLPEPRQVLKHNANRTVWRVPDLAGGLILKHYRGRSGEGLKTRLLGGRAEREFRAMEELCRLGLPSARPVGYSDRWAAGQLKESWFLSREVRPALTLYQALENSAAEEDVMRLCLLAIDAVACLHGHPFWHRDLHAGNLLLDGDGAIVIIDLHSVWRVPRLKRRHRMENLGRLLYSFRHALHLDDAPLLAARYATQRGEAVEACVRDTQAALERFEADHVRGRAARCMRNSSEFVGERSASGRSHRRREYAPEQFSEDLREHRRRALLGVDLLSNAAASRVSRVGGPGERRILKEYLPRGLGPALRARLGWGRARGAWTSARRGRVVGVPTPQALALHEAPDGSAVLVTRALDPNTDLTTWADALGPGELGKPDRRELALAVGHVVGRLSRAGLRHADMSGKNVLLVAGSVDLPVDRRLRPDPGWPRVELVDLDNMRRTRPHDQASLERMLGQLGDLSSVVTRTDRHRFSVGFQRGAGRALPRAVQEAATLRTEARQARRARLEQEASRRSG